MKQKDTYANFSALNAQEREDVDFCVCVVPRETVATEILAPHGGGTEPGTSQIAKQIAGKDLSYATFEGLKPTGNSRLHITSHVSRATVWLPRTYMRRLPISSGQPCLARDFHMNRRKGVGEIAASPTGSADRDARPGATCPCSAGQREVSRCRC